MSWEADYLALPVIPMEDVGEEGLAWILSRPKELRPLMTRFPPACVVRAKVPLLCPAPGTCGVVRSYFEPSEKYPAGLVGVEPAPDLDDVCRLRAQCAPEDLEVVGYWRGWTPERMAEVFRQVRD